MGVQFPGKKRYVTLEWPLIDSFSNIMFSHTYGNERMAVRRGWRAGMTAILHNYTSVHTIHTRLCMFPISR